MASEIKLKLVIDSRAGRILYAEADKEFVDFLITIISLPLANVVSLLKNHSMMGCLPNLYASVEALNETYWKKQIKDSVLRPYSYSIASSLSFPTALLGSGYSAAAPEFYTCQNDQHRDNVADNPKTYCHICWKESSHLCAYRPPQRGGDEGGYVQGLVSYMVMDDLSVKPMPSTTVTNITDLFDKFNIMDVRDLKEKVVTLSVDEGLRLLQASLQSKTVLTDMFWEGCCKSESDSTL